MKRRELLLVCSLLVPALVFGGTEAGIFNKKKKAAEKSAPAPAKKLSDYEKLFKDKRSHHAS